jgi:hypothetical protein
MGAGCHLTRLLAQSVTNRLEIHGDRLRPSPLPMRDPPLARGEDHRGELALWSAGPEQAAPVPNDLSVCVWLSHQEAVRNCVDSYGVGSMRLCPWRRVLRAAMHSSARCTASLLCVWPASCQEILNA